MWPNDSRVTGPDPASAFQDIGRDFCDNLNKEWVSRIKTALEDSPYYDFKIYFSPGLDSGAFQENLSVEEYAAWVLSYTDSAYRPHFISPFSANDSPLRFEPIEIPSIMSDQQTMWEMEVLKLLKESPEWAALSQTANLP